jgi:hypothetical protein
VKGTVTDRRVRRRKLLDACGGDRAQVRVIEMIIYGKAEARRRRKQQRQRRVA